MNESDVLAKHDKQIDGLKDALSSLATTVTVMANKQETLCERLSETVSAIGDVTDLQYTVKALGAETIQLSGRLTTLEDIAKVPISKRFWLSVKSWWFLWVPGAAAMGFIMEILYKLPPK